MGWHRSRVRRLLADEARWADPFRPTSDPLPTQAPTVEVGQSGESDPLPTHFRPTSDPPPNRYTRAITSPAPAPEKIVSLFGESPPDNGEDGNPSDRVSRSGILTDSHIVTSPPASPPQVAEPGGTDSDVALVHASHKALTTSKLRKKPNASDRTAIHEALTKPGARIEHPDEDTLRNATPAELALILEWAWKCEDREHLRSRPGQNGPLTLFSYKARHRLQSNLDAALLWRDGHRPAVSDADARAQRAIEETRAYQARLYGEAAK